MEVTFDFWTNLCGCGGGNVGGSCTMEMTEEELKLFQEVNGQAKEDEAEDAIRNYGLDCFNNLSQEEYDEMTMDELIDRCMEDNCDGVLDFYVVEISFD